MSNEAKQTTAAADDIEWMCEIERRLTLLEKLAVATGARSNVAPLLGHAGCVCPPGAEATCKGFACPRKEVRYGPGSFSGVRP